MIFLPVFLFILGFFSAQTSEAYIPPSFFIVRQIAKRHSDARQVRMTSKLEFFEGDTTPRSTFNQIFDFDALAKHRGQSAGGAGAVRITLQNLANGTRTVKDRYASSRDFPLIFTLQFAPSSSQIFDHFKRIGIPLKSEPALYSEKHPERPDLPYRLEENLSLMRWHGRIAIVMNSGANMHDTSAPQVWPQLWIEKDTFLPIRALVTSGLGAPEGTPPLEIRFTNYQAYQSTLLPKLTEGFRDGKLWFRSEITSVDLKTKGSSEPLEDHSSDSSDLENYLKWVL